MKKTKIFYLIIFTGLSSIVSSCKSNRGVSHTDSLKINAWNKLFTGSPHLTAAHGDFDKPVDTMLAHSCTEAYRAKFGDIEAGSGLKVTKAVGFSSSALKDWILQISSDQTIKMDNFRLRFGVYSTEFISRYSTSGDIMTDKKGRLTIFIWPYLGDKPAVYSTKGGDPVQPFNIGSLYP